ncbi:MAG: sterol desaturase family protein [Alphaproteobacteria bacterium]|nr:sterol desaturase family protein [Alphaproteobacteria bacterium]MDP6874254.1 sterol desaturase family protein [Alphaproteobacteria bacterium]
MSTSIMQNEGTIRLSIFLGVLVVMALWEVAAPRRRLSQDKPFRWFGNLGIVVLDTIVLRLVFPILAVGAAHWAEQKGWGLFNLLPLPGWLEVALAAALLDMIVYWQHRLFHMIPLFWRMHRMHHADPDYDVTTALRFHPLEIVLSMLIKLAAVMILGPAALAVLIFEVLLNGTAMFNHGNVRLALGLDRWLRLAVVTPDMHRVHHSVEAGEYNTNFGFNLPWWDRLFGSYQDQPALGHEGMEIGLRAYGGKVCANLIWMLVLPFKPLAAEAQGKEHDQG